MSRKKLDTIRSQITDLLATFEELEHSNCSRDEAIAKIDAYVDSCESQITVPATDFASRQSGFGGVHLSAPPQSSGMIDVGPVFAKLDPEGFKKLLTDELDRQIDEFGPSRKERDSELDKLNSQLFELETAEERIVCSLEAAGEVVERRTDIKNLSVVYMLVEPSTPKAA